ncbi:methyl-accepting chemotaxis protein signaling domain protein [Candidatus Magnetomorum sp. HK-1]|nr:methyl-accepting chemotaxis protein signaling domain protein [Candidatus Magnetomorum sp. HK-1]
MLIAIFTVTCLAFICTITVVSMKASNMANEQAIQIANEISCRYGQIVSSKIEIAFFAARGMAQTFEAIRNASDTPSRQLLDDIITDTIKSNLDFGAAWTAWEANAFDGNDNQFVNSKGSDNTGRCIPYWYKQNNKINVKALENYDLMGDGDYYQVPMNSESPAIINHFINLSKSTKEMVTSMAFPIVYFGMPVAVAGIDIPLSVFQNLISEIKLFRSGYAVLMDNTGKYLVHPESNKIFSIIETSLKWEKVVQAIKSGTEFIMKDYDNKMLNFIKPIKIGSINKPWALMISVPINEINEKSNNIIITAVLVSLFFLTLQIIIILFLSKSFINPLKDVIVFSEKVSKGDLTENICVNRFDEIGQMAKALNQMNSVLQKMVHEIISQAKTLSQASDELLLNAGDLASNSNLITAQALNVSNGSEEVSTNTHSIAANIEQMSTNVSNLSSTTSKMSKNVNTVSVSISEVSQEMNIAVQHAKDGKRIAIKGVQMAENAGATMGSLHEAAKEIGGVTDLIKKFSHRTNILAINASIEAASAGQAGKGFEVVANAIRKLSSQIRNAAEDISNRINVVRDNIMLSISVIDNVSHIINQFNESSDIITLSIEKQTESAQIIASNAKEADSRALNIAEQIKSLDEWSNDISINVSEMANATVEISNNIRGVSKAISSSNIRIGDVLTFAGDLDSLASKLVNIVEIFRISK